MLTRKEPLPSLDPARGFTVPRGDDTLAFRYLRPDYAAGLVEFIAGEEGPAQWCAIGAMIGAAWADPLLAMETPAPPLHRADREALLDYGDRVLAELHAAGWDLHGEIPLLYVRICEAHSRRQAAARGTGASPPAATGPESVPA